MKFANSISQIKCWASAVLFISAITAPQSAGAHGELHIRIATLTRRIQAATNDLASLYLQRGELYRQDQSWAEAESDYAHAAQFNPHLAAVDLCRAKLLDDSGQLPAAHEQFDKILNHSPDNGEALIGRARLLVKLNRPQSAIADFRDGLGLIPNPQPEYFLEFARLLASQHRTGDGLRSLDEGLKKFGAIESLQVFALELELEQNHVEAAIARLDTIIENAPRKETWLARRGDILLAAGRPIHAQKSFRSALDAIKLLPAVLQKAPPLQNLQSHLHAMLENSTRPPPH